MKTFLLTLIHAVLLFHIDAKEMVPVTSALKADGTISVNTGISGPIEISGYNVELNPTSGLAISPALVPPQWNNLGVGIDGNIFTIISQGGDIYVGGEFEDAAGIPDADYIARWDGCDWHAVVPGINGVVYALIFNGNTMYAAGSFAGHVGKWEGGVWSVLAGINNIVLALGVNTNGVYAAGFFTDASGNTDADGIARWNGSSWNAMGTGIELLDIFIDIATIGSDVYIGGYFNSSGGVPNTQNIAKWDGTVWNSVGGGLNQFITTIETIGTNLYVAGDFQNAGGNPNADEIAMWDGTTWNNVGSPPNFVDWPYRISISQDYIYTSSSGFGSSEPEMYRYDFQNNSWDYYPPTYIYAYALTQLGDELYMGSWNIWRWGEPSPFIEITGVPYQICQDAPPIALPTTQSGYTGTWSGTGVVNNIFNPAGLDFNSYELTFTPDPGQCVAPVYYYIYVYLNADYLYPLNNFCETDDPISLIPYQNGINGEWSGPGVTNNTFDPSGLYGYILLSFTPNPGECAEADEDETFVALAIIPQISGIPNSICEDGNPISLPMIQAGINGDWSGQGVSNNSFDPSGLNGSITLTFTPDPGECANVNTTAIQVNPVITIIITGVPNALCQLSPPIVLTITQNGIQGNWSGQGVANNTFNPANLVGNITLIFTPNAGQCAYATTTAIQVYFYVPVISGIPGSVCESIPPFPLSTTQGGFNGNWSGPGVSNNIFNPTGNYGVVTLTFIPVTGQCGIAITQNIIVDPTLIPGISGLPVSLCTLSPPVELPDIEDGIEGNWSGPGVESNYFNPSGLSGEVTLIFFPEPGQCAISNDAIIIVQDEIIPSITGAPSFLCENAKPQLLPDFQSGIPGYWSGPGVTNNFLNPSGLHGNIVLTFTPLESECTVSNTWNVIIDTSFVPGLSGLPSKVCQTDTPIPLSSVQTGFIGTWSGTGVSNDTFNAGGLNGLVQLTFNPNADQCAVSAEGTIFVNTPTHLVLSLPDSLCQKDDPVELSHFQDSIPGVWVGPGIENNYFSPDSQSGNVVLFFIPVNGACEDTAKDQIHIQTLPSFTNLLVACDSISNTYTVSFDITGGDPAGYMVDGVPVLTGNFISTAYPFGATYYSFILEDGSICGPVSVLGSNSCICFSDAGTMNFNGAPLKICRGPKFTLAYNGDGHLDPDDLLLFALHDNGGNQLGNIYAVRDQPVFSFVPGMLTGQTYYISSLTGTNNGNGFIDLNDPCLSVSQGVPVIFFDCEPDVQNTDPVSLDRGTFNPPFNDETDVDQNTSGGNGTNRKLQALNTLNTLSSNSGSLDEELASIISDPKSTIKEFDMYDVYGRLVYKEKDIPVHNSLIYSKNNIQNSTMAPGFYVFTVEVQKGNGEVFYMNGCRVMFW